MPQGRLSRARKKRPTIPRTAKGVQGRRPCRGERSNWSGAKPAGVAKPSWGWVRKRPKMIFQTIIWGEKARSAAPPKRRPPPTSRARDCLLRAAGSRKIRCTSPSTSPAGRRRKRAFTQ